ncbi:MAG: sialidase family protein [Bacteroidota bacterium]
MRLLFCYLLLSLLPTYTVLHAQKVSEQLKYLGQEPPGLIPEVFAPGLISKNDASEFGSVFNKDATTFFYAVDNNGKAEIRYSALRGNKWSSPQTLFAHEAYGFNDPFLSPDEKRLYFISQKASEGAGAKRDYDIWYVEKQHDSWSEPINAGPNINSGKDEYYISFTREGTMYFSSNKNTPKKERSSFDIYSSKNINGQFQPAVQLGPSVNTSNYEADVFVAPDESYLIFCARRPEGLGRGDLYISYKNIDGTWTKAINMGNKINTAKHELCPFVSMDGKYFFYTSNQDIYWVSTKIITELKEKIKD